MEPLGAQIDQSDSARIIFNRPVTIDEAVRHLWARPPVSAGALRRDPAESMLSSGRQRRFLIDKSNMDLLFSLQHGLANEYVRRVRPIMSTAPATLPSWVPEPGRSAALAGRLPNGVSRFPGTPPWGDVVIWVQNSSGYLHIQAYQEFPDNREYYLSAAHGDERTARLLHGVYAQFNRDMKYFVEERRLSPSMARDEIRRINDELFKLVIEGAVAVLTAGAGIAAVNNAIRQNAQQVARAAERSGLRVAAPSGRTGAQFAQQLRRAGKRVVVNIGGTGEVADAVNVNPNRVAPRRDIPNLVEAEAEGLGGLFDMGSVDEIVSNRLPPNTLDWSRVLPGATQVLRPGGKIIIRFQGVGRDAAVIVPLLERLGFREIRNYAGAVVEAVR